MSDDRSTSLLTWIGLHAGRNEGRADGWRAIVEWVSEEDLWNAFIEPLSGGERIIASTKFVGRIQGEIAAQKWCEAEIIKRSSRVRIALGLETPMPIAELRQRILSRLQAYDTQTVVELIISTLLVWGREHVQATNNSIAYRNVGNSWAGREPGSYFVSTLVRMGFKRASTPLSQGLTHLDKTQMEYEAEMWGVELGQLPFYETIYTFTLAVHDWLETCDLGDMKQEWESEAQTINNWIIGWEYALGIN